MKVARVPEKFFLELSIAIYGINLQLSVTFDAPELQNKDDL